MLVNVRELFNVENPLSLLLRLTVPGGLYPSGDLYNFSFFFSLCEEVEGCHLVILRAAGILFGKRNS